MAYTVVPIPTTTWTRALVSHGPDELLRVSLPAPWEVRHEQATIMFLEGLLLWLDIQIRVVLSVDVRAAPCCLGLTDEMGRSMGSVFCEVEVRDHEDRGHRDRRDAAARGTCDFTDLRQLSMAGLGGGD